MGAAAVGGECNFRYEYFIMQNMLPQVTWGESRDKREEVWDEHIDGREDLLYDGRKLPDENREGNGMRSNLTTLCYIEKNDSYLMLHRVKKEKDINKDKWIGVGGHFEAGESPEECLLRETREETGLTLTSWKLRGIITFGTDVQETEYMFLYTADGYEGTMTECNEGTLEWVPKARMAQLPMWEGDRIFFRLLEEDADFFSLKMRYEGDRLAEAVLNGVPVEDQQVCR